MDAPMASSPSDSPSSSSSHVTSPALSSLDGCSSESDAGESQANPASCSPQSRKRARKRARALSPPPSDSKAAGIVLSKIERHESNALTLEDAAAVLTQCQEKLQLLAAALSDPALGSPLTRLAAAMAVVSDETAAAARSEVDEASRCKQAFLSEQQARLKAIQDVMAEFVLKADALESSRVARARVEVSHDAIDAIDLTSDAVDEKGSSVDVLSASPKRPIATLVACLQSHRRLTGDVINAYLERLTASCAERGSLVALSSYLYPTLVMKPASILRPQKRPTDVLAARFVLVPIHLKEEEHWALVIADVTRGCLLYVDSLLGHRTDVTKLISGYLNSDAVRKSRPVVSWTDVMCSAPRQENSIDCGVFVCMAAHSMAMHVQDTARQSGTDIVWYGTQSHAARFRAHIRNTLMQRDGAFVPFQFASPEKSAP